jgi:hypothetical protein
MRTYRVGQTIYHGWRYWKSEKLDAGEVLGWNTKYRAYQVVKITKARLYVERRTGELAWNVIRIQLNRETMEREGKQYHTRFHEYFYAEKPKPESKDWNWAGSRAYTYNLPTFGQVFGVECLTTLGLSLPVTRADVRRAYKRLAKTAHPDLGGSHQEFIRLKQAHDSALRFASA